MGLTGKISAAIILAIFFLSLFSSLIVPYNPDSIDLDSLKQHPSVRHWLGTDNKGRDILARVLHGGKTSIGISVIAALLSMGVGLLAGLISGYYGGKIDIFFMALVDLILAFPSLLLAIGISIILPAGIYTVMIALSFVGWASFSRIIRGHVLSVRESSYIEAAKAIGCNDMRILFVHIFPQCIPLSIVITGMKLSGYILTEAALSFLGLGAQPPAATWGSMISANRVFISSASWMVFPPGIMIAVTALCFNVLGDEIKKIYDARGGFLSSLKNELK